jgi:hypothetical protein
VANCSGFWIYLNPAPDPPLAWPCKLDVLVGDCSANVPNGFVYINGAGGRAIITRRLWLVAVDRRERRRVPEDVRVGIRNDVAGQVVDRRTLGGNWSVAEPPPFESSVNHARFGPLRLSRERPRPSDGAVLCPRGLLCRARHTAFILPNATPESAAVVVLSRSATGV